MGIFVFALPSDRIGTRLFGGCKANIDAKIKACGAKRPSAEANVSAVVCRWAFEENREYLSRSRELDVELGTPPGIRV